MTALTVLQLDTHFPRVAGDVGSPHSYLEVPQIIRVPGAGVAGIVTDRPQDIDITPFQDALAQAHGDLVVTSCGFLAPWQDHLAAQTDRPFIASALSALDDLAQFFTPSEVLIVTFDAARLGAAHLGQHADFAGSICGLPPDMHLRRVIEGDSDTLDTARATQDLVGLLQTHVDPVAHRHILLECTNLPPYAPALRATFGLAVTDVLTCIERARPGTVKPRFLA
ncbi:aspartate/glutamate racemase family protein [Sulfitobacter sp. S190]|uniref:aspartate/glutamate racemase family protein n=1 Tax=Sulfitobacter sp. S190 TaxID=2867022 RepID=UPI0021A3A047|nr:aspartate/glutamate racemase family protein [Sulfitobacter sp. S190]UWR21913.1 hypothetical protein K3756_14675 [Sulfitobacter sp. S190]